jgi:large subunit ribosomal protein L28
MDPKTGESLSTLLIRPQGSLPGAGPEKLEPARRCSNHIGHGPSLVPVSCNIGHLIGSVAVMSSVCDICGKSPGFGNNISHSHRRTRRRWNPNIQKLRVLVKGSPQRLNVCTKCLKANKVSKLVG